MNAMPYLHSHKEALEHAKTVVPIRGSNQLPLGPRKKAANFNMSVHLNGTGDSVSIMVWGVNRITFYPGGVIGLYNNRRSTADQTGLREISEVLGVPVKVHDYRTWIELREGWIPVPSEGLSLQRTDSGDLTFHPAFPDQYPEMWRVNRQGMKELRREYASFRKYASATIKLKGEDGITDEDWRTSWGVTSSLQTQFPPFIRDRERARECLAMARGEHGSSGDFTPDMMRFRAFMWVGRGSWRNPNSFLSKNWSEAFDQVLMRAHPDVALELKTVTSGKLFVDRYAQFARGL